MGALAQSSDATRCATFAARAMSEERYHLRHADALLDALAGRRGCRCAPGRRRWPTCSRSVWRCSTNPPALTTAVGGLVGRPFAAPRPASGRPLVDRRFGGRDWTAIEPVAQAGRTMRSGSFASVYADMREVIMLDPDATW